MNKHKHRCMHKSYRTFGAGYLSIQSLNWESLGLNEKFLHHRVTCFTFWRKIIVSIWTDGWFIILKLPNTLVDSRRSATFTWVCVVSGCSHGHIVASQFGAVDEEMMNQIGLRWNAQLNRVITRLFIPDYSNRLWSPQSESNGQCLVCVVEDGHFELQLFGPFHRVRQVNFKEEWLESFDFRRWTHSKAFSFRYTKRLSDPVTNRVRQFNRLFQFTIGTANKKTKIIILIYPFIAMRTISNYSKGTKSHSHVSGK